MTEQGVEAAKRPPSCFAASCEDVARGQSLLPLVGPCKTPPKLRCIAQRCNRAGRENVRRAQKNHARLPGQMQGVVVVDF